MRTIFSYIANLFKAKDNKGVLNSSAFEFPVYPTMKVPHLKLSASLQGVDDEENVLLNYTADVCQSVFNSLESRGLGKDAIRDYIKHLPPSDNDKVNDIIEQCLHVLYQYSQEQEYIQNCKSYQDFRTLNW